MATQTKINDVFDEIINAGPNPAATMPAAAPSGKTATKLMAPGTAPVGPRNAGANACEAGRADRSHLHSSTRRTSLRGSFLTQAILSEPGSDGEGQETLKVTDLVLTGVRFLSPVPLRPGTVRQLRTNGNDDAKLASAIRVVSTRVRADGHFDVTAEFY